MQRNYKIIGVLLVALAIGAGVWAYIRSGQNAYVVIVEDVQKGEAEADIAKYDVAKLQGDLAGKCAQAKLIAAHYLSANVNEKYARWKSIEETDCAQSEPVQPAQDESMTKADQTPAANEAPVDQMPVDPAQSDQDGAQ